MPAHDTGDIAVYDIGGVNLRSLFEDVTYSIDETQIDGSSVVRAGKRAQGTKLAAQIQTKVSSLLGSGDRVTHLNLTAFALGATSYLGVLRNLRLSGSFEQRQRAGVGAWFKRPQNTAKDYQAEFELDCENDVASALMTLMHSTTSADRNAALGFTLNGGAITIPMRLQRIEHRGARNDLQVLRVTMTGRDPGGSADYPTAPTGTTSLLEKAFNSFKSEFAFNYTSKTLDGFNVAGNCIISGFTLEVPDEGEATEQYTFDSVGTVAATAT